MPKASIKIGTTSKRIKVRFRDTSVTSKNQGLTGLVYNSAGLTAYYHRDGDTLATPINLVNATVGTWVSGGFKEIDATNMPGVYEVGLPNAALASGSSVVIVFKGASNMEEYPLEFELTATDNQDAAAGGMSRLDAAVASRMASFTLPVNFPSLAIDPSGHVTLADGSLVTAKLGTFVLQKTTHITGFNDIAATAIVSAGAITTNGGAVSNVGVVGAVTGDLGGKVLGGGAGAITGVGVRAVDGGGNAIAPASTAVDNTVLTGARIAKLDNLDVANSAINSAVAAITSQGALMRVIAPDQIPTPSTGSTTFEFRVYLFDADGDNVDADGASNGVGSVTFSVANVAGTSYNAKLGAVTWVSTGVYKVTYTVQSADPAEQINISCSAVVGTKTRTLADSSWVAPYFATTFTSTDRTTLNNLSTLVNTNLNATMTSRAADADIQTLLGRLTAPRAGYLDNISSPVPTASQVSTAVWADGGRSLTTAERSAIAAAVRDVSNSAPVAGSVGDKINQAAAATGGGGLSLTDLVTMRNQDAVTAPTVADCLYGGWISAFSKQYTPPNGSTSTVTGGYILYAPDKSTPVRTFDVTVESSTGEFTGRS